MSNLSRYRFALRRAEAGESDFFAVTCGGDGYKVFCKEHLPEGLPEGVARRLSVVEALGMDAECDHPGCDAAA